jgi:nicotinamidase-related amidase
MTEEQAMKNQALLVIDVQQGLFRRKTPVFNEKQLLTNICTLVQRARAKKVPVIFG